MEYKLGRNLKKEEEKVEEQNLLEAILNEAKQEAQRIIEEAKYESGKIVEQNKQKIENEKQKEIQKYQEEIANQKENEIGNCKLNARNQVLAQKQKWIQKVKRDIQNKIEQTNGKEYVTLIQNILENAKPQEKGVILLPVKEREAISNLAKQKGLEVKSVENFEAGFILQYGKVEHNYVLDTLLALQEETIDEMIVKILF